MFDAGELGMSFNAMTSDLARGAFLLKIACLVLFISLLVFQRHELVWLCDPPTVSGAAGPKHDP